MIWREHVIWKWAKLRKCLWGGKVTTLFNTLQNHIFSNKKEFQFWPFFFLQLTCTKIFFCKMFREDTQKKVLFYVRLPLVYLIWLHVGQWNPDAKKSRLSWRRSDIVILKEVGVVKTQKGYCWRSNFGTCFIFFLNILILF